MTFGYDSKVAFTRSTASIDDFALDLLDRILAVRPTEVIVFSFPLPSLKLTLWVMQARSKPLVFVCHSLGGIVVKKVTAPFSTLPFAAR